MRYIGAINIWFQYAVDSIIRDPIKQRVLYLANCVQLVSFFKLRTKWFKDSFEKDKFFT